MTAFQRFGQFDTIESEFSDLKLIPKWRYFSYREIGKLSLTIGLPKKQGITKVEEDKSLILRSKLNRSPKVRSNKISYLYE